MTDSELRSRFNFGAPASWRTESSSPADGVPAAQNLPGAYIHVDDVPNIPRNVPAPPPPPPNAAQQNPDKTCRICLSGAEDGRILLI